MSGLVDWICEGVLGLCFVGYWSLAVCNLCFDVLVVCTDACLMRNGLNWCMLAFFCSSSSWNLSEVCKNVWAKALLSFAGQFQPFPNYPFSPPFPAIPNYSMGGYGGYGGYAGYGGYGGFNSHYQQQQQQRHYPCPQQNYHHAPKDSRKANEKQREKVQQEKEKKVSI